MGDYIVYPHHMQRNPTVGDVTFGDRESSGIHISKYTKLDPKFKIIKKHFVLEFKEGGTGFIVNALQNPIIIKTEQGKRHILGLILTAGHVVCDTITFKPIRKSFRCIVNDFEADAVFLRSFMQDYPEPMISESNGNAFVYPGDLALCLLVSAKKRKLQHIPIASHSEILRGMSVIIAGYPKPPEDPLYCCPQLRGSTSKELLKEINKAFHNFESLVYSDEKIIGMTNCLLDINCAATNGMSGGPIFSAETNKIVGIYVGGPPLPGQHQLYIVSQLIQQGQYAEALHRLNIIMIENSEFYKTFDYYPELEEIVMMIMHLDRQINSEAGPIDVKIQTKVKECILKTALKKYSYLYEDFIEDNSQLFRKMGLNLNQERGNYYKIYAYLSQRGEPDKSIPRFVELKERAGFLAYIYSEIRGIRPQLDAELFANEFDRCQLDCCKSVLVELVKNFQQKCTDATHSMIGDYFNPKELIFNVGISVMHPAFNYIQSVIETINSSSGKTYVSMKSFLFSVGYRDFSDLD